MELDIRKCNQYLEVKVKAGNSVIDLGLFDDKERKELALELQQAIDELMNGLDTTP